MQFLFLLMVPALNSIFSVAFLFTLSFTLSRMFSCKTQKFVRLSKFQKSPKNLAISTKNGIREVPRIPFSLAGVAGFEPTNAAVKVLCLTA